MTIIESIKPVGDATVERLRKDYPDEAHLGDEALLKRFGYEGHKYEASALWDHVGDAATDYNKLADFILEKCGRMNDE
jgi:hypothetical protein